MSDPKRVSTSGIVLHSPPSVRHHRLATAGKESAFRKQLLELAGVTWPVGVGSGRKLRMTGSRGRRIGLGVSL